MTRTAEPLPRTRSWSAVYCRLAWRTEDVDHFLVHHVRPLLDGLRMAGLSADWYFQRTAGDLRLHLRGADWCTVKALRADLARLVAQARYPLAAGVPHGDIGEVEHTVDADRFGGDSALPYAEDVFCRAAELALTTLAVPGARVTAATELVMATAHALRLDRRATSAWLRSGAVGPEPRTQALDVRWDRLSRTRDHTLIRWTNAVRRTRRTVEGHAEAAPSGRWLSVWGEQLHGLLNQVGLTSAEERALCLRTASALTVRDPVYLDLATAV